MNRSASETMNNGLAIVAGIGGLVLGWGMLEGPMRFVSAAVGGVLAKAVTQKVLN